MNIPSTSIIVAKNGPAENAGSILSICNTKGKQLPNIVASNTIVASENPIAKLSNNVPPV